MLSPLPSSNHASSIYAAYIAINIFSNSCASPHAHSHCTVVMKPWTETGCMRGEMMLRIAKSMVSENDVYVKIRA